MYVFLFLYEYEYMQSTYKILFRHCAFFICVSVCGMWLQVRVHTQKYICIHIHVWIYIHTFIHVHQVFKEKKRKWTLYTRTHTPRWSWTTRSLSLDTQAPLGPG